MRSHLATLIDDLTRIGDETAIVRYVGNRRRATSYGDLARLAGRFAAFIAQHGIAAGDRVVIWGENSAEWVAAFYGCMMRGAIAVPLDAYGAVAFAELVVADVSPKLIVGDTALLTGLPGYLPKLAFEAWHASLPAAPAETISGLSHETPLQILFTSGTTGTPKGIVHTHGNILASVEPIERAAQPYLRYERLVHPLRFLHTLPLSHVFGQTMGLWIPPIFGAEVYFESRLTPARIIETVQRERISVISAVPRVLATLKRHLEAKRPELTARLAAAQGIPAWRRWWRFRAIHAEFGLKFWTFITGGSALAPELEEFWNRLGFVLVQGYGMTETAALITLNHPFKVARGTMGRPLPGREVRIGDDGEVLVRGPMISTATWAGGQLRQRQGEWLATGDLAQADATGELRFAGRKSETIVTAAGVNLHPEDLEAALESQPEVAGCVVLPIETATGTEACAVLALRSGPEAAAEVVHRANQRLAEFQRLRRWRVWPGPDLLRTATGKVKRSAVAAWLAETRPDASNANRVEAADWLLALIAEVTGEAPERQPLAESGRDLRLTEDLRLDSLGRVQLLEALEERLVVSIDPIAYERAETLGAIRRLIGGAGRVEAVSEIEALATMPPREPLDHAGHDLEEDAAAQPVRADRGDRFVYPRWPWLWLFRWLRLVFVEALLRPLVWLLAAPRVVWLEPPVAGTPGKDGPMLIIANHVTAYDVPLMLFALPGGARDRTTVAMSGEMLEDFRHARNQHPEWLNPLGPAAWLLMTALFNVFPLPRRRDFQRSFAHAGEALDHGFHVVVFPEGTRSKDGTLAPFKPGIGLLARESMVPVLPMALVGVGELKARGGRWFRSGRIEVRVGEPLRIAPGEGEAEIARRLHDSVRRLLQGGGAHPCP
jgi:long-chain acyl-CoA synthetase